MKEQITSFMEEKFSFSLSAYRKDYSTQHVLTNLIEEWKEKLDINYVVGELSLWTSQRLLTVSHTT